MERQKSGTDYLWRLPVEATIVYPVGESPVRIMSKLPNGYACGDSQYSFPAGYQEIYMVNNKCYNFHGYTPLEEQKNAVVNDLELNGFSREEAEEYINSLKVIEGEKTTFLDIGGSMKWLQNHPEFKDDALKILNDAISEIIREDENRSESRIRRRVR